MNAPKNKLIYIFAGINIGFLMALGMTVMAENTELDTGPRAIPYNGILALDGEAFEGLADLQFRLTDDAECTFSEDHEDVSVFGGRFAVNIGSVAGDLPACLFDSEDVFIEIAVRPGEDEGEHTALAGRQKINPVPFAYWAAEGSDFKVDGNANIEGNLTVPTIGNLDSINIGGRPLEIGGHLTVGGNLNLTGPIADADSRVIVDDGLTVNNSLTVNNDFKVGGNIVTGDDDDRSDTVIVDDRLHVQGDQIRIGAPDFDFRAVFSQGDNLTFGSSNEPTRVQGSTVTVQGNLILENNLAGNGQCAWSGCYDLPRAIGCGQGQYMAGIALGNPANSNDDLDGCGDDGNDDVRILCCTMDRSRLNNGEDGGVDEFVRNGNNDVDNYLNGANF